MDGKQLVDSNRRDSAQITSADAIDSSVWHNFEWLVDRKEKQGKYLQGFDIDESSLEKIFNGWINNTEACSSVSYSACSEYSRHEIITSLELIYNRLDIIRKFQSVGSVFIKIGLIEAKPWENHITTAPIFLESLIEFLHSVNPKMNISIGDGSGHERDVETLLHICGLKDIFDKYANLVKYVDLNTEDLMAVNIPNPFTFQQIMLPSKLLLSDVIISLAKLKTHHWTGVTLGMKNMFGTMPGSVYGFPKNRLHWASYPRVITDILSVLKPHLTIIDGIIGIEGNGPLHGEKKNTGIIIAGEDPVATDSFAAQMMGISPILLPILWYPALKNIGNWYPLLVNIDPDIIKPYMPPPNWPWLYSSISKEPSEQLSIAKSLLLNEQQ